MRHWQCLRIAVVACVLWSGLARAADQPNIILVMSDDYGWPYYSFMIDYLRRQLGVAGDPHAPGECFHPFSEDPTTTGVPCAPNMPVGTGCETYICTPNLDLLAREGIAFDRAVVTAPACTWSHESLFTGLNRRDVLKFPSVGCDSGPPADLHRAQTIPEALGGGKAKSGPSGNYAGGLGYHTLLKGKWWLGNEANFFNDLIAGPNGTSVLPPNTTGPGNMRSENDKTIGETKSIEGLKRWIMAQDKTHPWFVVWTPEVPHYSYSGVEHANLSGFYDAMETNNPEHITTTNFGTQATREYFESISYFDARVGELVHFLDRLECEGTITDGELTTIDTIQQYTADDSPAKRDPLLGTGCPAAAVYECTTPAPRPHAHDDFRSNTLIVYVTDNPAGVQESKAHFTENGLRAPIIVNFPKRIPPSEDRDADGDPDLYTPHHALVSAIDIFPTILEYAGERGFGSAQNPQPRRFPDARSFRTIAEAPDAYTRGRIVADSRRYLFSNTTSGTTGMRSVTESSVFATDYLERGVNPDSQVCVVPKPSGFKLYNNSQNPDSQTQPDALTNLEEDPFEVIYAKNEFLNEGTGDTPPKYSDPTDPNFNQLVRTNLNDRLRNWFVCPCKVEASDASSKPVRDSLATVPCSTTPVKCANPPCAGAPTPGPCERYATGPYVPTPPAQCPYP